MKFRKKSRNSTGGGSRQLLAMFQNGKPNLDVVFCIFSTTTNRWLLKWWNLTSNSPRSQATFVTVYPLCETDEQQLAWQSEWNAEKNATENLTVFYSKLCFVCSVFIVINQHWYIFCVEQDEKASFLLFPFTRRIPNLQHKSIFKRA